MKQRNQIYSCAELQQEKRFECDDPSDEYKGTEDGPAKRPIRSIAHNINYNICFGTLALALCTFITANQTYQLIESNARQPVENPATDKDIGNGSNASSFSDLLTTGLDYELAERLQLALGAYREAYKDQAITREARAFVLSRIAELRFREGYPEEALKDARFAVELGGPKPLYLHALARILINQCLIDEAEQRLSQIHGDNAITADLRTEIADSRGNCPVG